MITLPTEDRLAITELSSHYAFFCDTRAYRAVSTLFHDTATWDETVIGNPYCNGREQIHAFFSSMEHADLEYVVHINGNHRLAERRVDTVIGTVHLHVEGRFNGKSIRIFGYYADEYVKVAGGWLFGKRQLVEIAPSTGFQG